ncbi:unnamed protein product, partial [Sphenostylis stenocarpa]
SKTTGTADDDELADNSYQLKHSRDTNQYTVEEGDQSIDPTKIDPPERIVGEQEEDTLDDLPKEWIVPRDLSLDN